MTRKNMPQKTTASTKKRSSNKKVSRTGGNFHFDYINDQQSFVLPAYMQHDVLFLLGPAGTGKTFLSCALACKEILDGTKKHIVLTRPIVEAGESLGFLPGEFEEKVNPYMVPMFNCIDKLLGKENSGWRQKIEESIQICPLAYMRGLSFEDSICIFDEAQNATKKQMKLFLTRFCSGSKIIITGDPSQSDIEGNTALMDVFNALKDIKDIGHVTFKESGIVRHHLVKEIIQAFPE